MDQNDVDFTEKKLKIAYFFVEKKMFFKKIFIGSLILFDLFLFLFAAYHFINYFSQSKEYEEMMKELTVKNIDYNNLHLAITPLSPEIIFSKAILVGQGKYHLICQIRNPNRTWFIESLTYRFSAGGIFESKKFNTFILPEEEKILVNFDEKINHGLSAISCDFEEIKWRRIRATDYERLKILENFLIRDLQNITPPNLEGRSITQFRFINSSVYNFWEINLLIVLYEGSEIIAVGKTKLDQIMSQEEREIKIIWPTVISFISKTEVVPEINIFDPDLFIQQQPKPE